jgi:hypothetical protein
MMRPILGFSATSLTLFTATIFSLQAHAQQEGFYQGQTADGHPVTVAVAKTSDGRLGLFSLDAGFSAKCDGITHRYHGSVNRFFPENHFVNNRKKFNFTNFHVVHAAGQIVFQSETEASGTIGAKAAVFPHEHGTPTQVEYCVSAPQTFTVTFQFDGAAKSRLLTNAANAARAKPAFTWRH